MSSRLLKSSHGLIRRRNPARPFFSNSLETICVTPQTWGSLPQRSANTNRVSPKSLVFSDNDASVSSGVYDFGVTDHIDHASESINPGNPDMETFTGVSDVVDTEYIDEISRRFDILSVSECVEFINKSSVYTESSAYFEYLLAKVSERLVFSISNIKAGDLSPEETVECLNALLRVNSYHPASIDEACANLMEHTYLSDWLADTKLLWKFKKSMKKCARILINSIGNLDINTITSHIHTCRLLDLIVGLSEETLNPQLGRLLENLSEMEIVGTDRKSLFSTITLISQTSQNHPIWSLQDQLHSLVISQIRNQCLTKKPSRSSLGLGTCMIRTGGIAQYRSKSAYDVIHDALAFRAPSNDHEAINAQLKIAIAYRLPGQYMGEYGPRKRASMAARNFFLPCQMTNACCTLLAEHASFDSIDSGQEQLGSFWYRIYEKLIENGGGHSVENLIRFVLAVDRAKENGRCPLTVADLINKSLTPLIIIQVRRQEFTAQNIIDLLFTSSCALTHRLSLELILKIVGQLRSPYGTALSCLSEVLTLITMCSPSDVSTETLNSLSEYVEKNLNEDPSILIKIVHASRRIGRLNDGWFRLGESAVSSLLSRPDCKLNLDDLVCLGDYIVMANSSDDHVKTWIRFARRTQQPPPAMEDILSELKAKKNLIRMYCEYPDGTHRLAASDNQIKKAAFCGIFLTLTLGLSDGLFSVLDKKKK